MLERITIPRPDDWHVHFREGALLAVTLAASARCFGRCVAMPNLAKPLTTAAAISAYGEELTVQLSRLSKFSAAGDSNRGGTPAGSAETTPPAPSFTPLLTMYLTDDSDAEELVRAKKIKNFFAVKCYPRGATTNSAHGVSDLNNCAKFLDKMQELGVPLLIHGESPAPAADVFDREKIFIDKTLIPLRRNFPELKITLEHISSIEAADYIKQADARTAATITPQHLRYNRNHMLGDGIRPHLYCKPILKREEDRLSLVSLIKAGLPRVFLGSDSAPHRQQDKESSCGCAGVFSAAYLLETIAQIFEDMGELQTADKLTSFVSLNGAKFYGFPPAKDSITLVREVTHIPAEINLANNDKIIPLGAGGKVNWKVEPPKT